MKNDDITNVVIIIFLGLAGYGYLNKWNDNYLLGLVLMALIVGVLRDRISEWWS